MGPRIDGRGRTGVFGHQRDRAADPAHPLAPDDDLRHLGHGVRAVVACVHPWPALESHVVACPRHLCGGLFPAQLRCGQGLPDDPLLFDDLQPGRTHDPAGRSQGPDRRRTARTAGGAPQAGASLRPPIRSPAWRTGASSSDGWRPRLPMQTMPARRFPVLALDLDRFKAINDTYGHQAGDHVLQRFAKKCLEAIRPHDGVARVGGEEFMVLLPKIPLSAAIPPSRSRRWLSTAGRPAKARWPGPAARASSSGR